MNRFNPMLLCWLLVLVVLASCSSNPPPPVEPKPVRPNYAWDDGHAAGLAEGKEAAKSLKKPLSGKELDRRVWDLCYKKYPPAKEAGDSRSYNLAEWGYPLGLKQGFQEGMHERWPDKCPPAEVVSAQEMEARFHNKDQIPMNWEGPCDLGPRP